MQNSRQNWQIAWEDERARRKTKQLRSRGGAPLCIPGSTTVRPPPRVVVHTTGCPWSLLPSRTTHNPAPRMLRFGPCLVHVLCMCWVILGSFSIFLDPLGPQKHLLILSFRLVNLNSVKILKTSKTTQNRRNRDINRINIHFSPLKWLLNTLLIHANMALIRCNHH